MGGKSNIKIRRRVEVLDRKKSYVTTLKISGDVSVSQIYDYDLEVMGIATEPGSLLIDQKATEELLGRPAGFKPEEYLKNVENGIGLMGGHFGWQKGAFLIKKSELITIKNEALDLNGHFTTLLHKDGRWHVETLHVVYGEPTEDCQKMLYRASGFNGAQIVKDGKVVPVYELCEDPRILADARNVVDFSAGNDVPGQFFADVRKIPISSSKLRSLVEGKKSTTFKLVKSGDQDIEEARKRFTLTAGKLKEYNTYSYFLGEPGIISGEDGTIIDVIGPLPEQKMPLVGFGCDDDGNLIIVAIDGRQPGSTGASIRQLAELLVENGAVNGILGAGGGDVAVVEKKDGETIILNSPANVDKDTGERVTRRVPNLLIFG